MATYVPNARQQFCDANGTPLAAGSVGMYVVGTLTAKNTWQDQAQTTLNSNPIALDSGGYANIYGTGQYRQVVKDQAGNTVWDRVVSCVSGPLPTVLDYGAVEDGATDDAAAVATAATLGPFVVPHGTLKTNSAPAAFDMISIGASFTGTAPLDSLYPAFDPGVIQVIQKGSARNCFIGIAHNSLPASTNAEPTGVTGYSRIDNGGNAGFGMFGRADLYATTGVATNELDSFNFGAAPNIANLPPNRAIGTTQSQPIALTVAAGGTFNSSIGIHICKEGSAPQQFLVGQYIAPDAIVNYGIVVDAVAASTQVPALLKHGVGAIGLQIQGVGTPVPANSFLQYTDGAGSIQFTVKQDGSITGSRLTLTPVAVASLPAAGTAGRRAFVTDATATTFASVVAGSGTNKVPVYDDGTSWRIG